MRMTYGKTARQIVDLIELLNEDTRHAKIVYSSIRKMRRCGHTNE